MAKKRNLVILVFFVFLIAGFIRFYNFPSRINFGPEQAISLIVSGDYLKDKLTLLGQPNIQRTTHSGLILYSPAIFNYSLIPLILLLNYNPVYITYYFAFLNLITGLALFLIVRKVFKFSVAIFSTILFLFNSTMILHSTFIWTHNYIPLLNIFIPFLLYKFRIQNKSIYLPILLGFLNSLCLSPEYFYIFTMIFVFGVMIYFSKKRVLSIPLFLLGAALGMFPTILFDLKHNFYHLTTLWEYSLDTLHNPSQTKIIYYHFLQFWPLAALFGGFILNFFWKKSKLVSLGLCALYIFINLNTNEVFFNKVVGVAEGVTISKIESGAQAIAKDSPINFNVASTLEFDSPRAYPLRYFLRFKYGINPESVENYLNISTLYVLATNNYDFNHSTLWEVSARKPNKITKLEDLDDKYTIFKLAY